MSDLTETEMRALVSRARGVCFAFAPPDNRNTEARVMAEQVERAVAEIRRHRAASPLTPEERDDLRELARHCEGRSMRARDDEFVSDEAVTMERQARLLRRLAGGVLPAADRSGKSLLAAWDATPGPPMPAPSLDELARSGEQARRERRDDERHLAAMESVSIGSPTAAPGEILSALDDAGILLGRIARDVGRPVDHVECINMARRIAGVLHGVSAAPGGPVLVDALAALVYEAERRVHAGESTVNAQDAIRRILAEHTAPVVTATDAPGPAVTMAAPGGPDLRAVALEAAGAIDTLVGEVHAAYGESDDHGGVAGRLRVLATAPRADADRKRSLATVLREQCERQDRSALVRDLVRLFDTQAEAIQKRHAYELPPVAIRRVLDAHLGVRAPAMPGERVTVADCLRELHHQGWKGTHIVDAYVTIGCRLRLDAGGWIEADDGLGWKRWHPNADDLQRGASIVPLDGAP